MKAGNVIESIWMISKRMGVEEDRIDIFVLAQLKTAVESGIRDEEVKRDLLRVIELSVERIKNKDVSGEVRLDEEEIE